jgi:hypothetical protein
MTNTIKKTEKLNIIKLDISVKIKFEHEQIKFDMNCFQIKELNQIDLNFEFKSNNINIGKLMVEKKNLMQFFF